MLPQGVLEELERKARKYGTRKILVQLPEGLKPKAKEISESLASRGFEPIVSGDPCFGACDLKFLENAITLHVGHSRMLDLEPVVYWEYRYDLNPWPSIEKNLGEIKENKLGIVTTVQHIGFLEEVKEKLEKSGKTAVIGNPGPRVTYPGQVLGCDASTAISIMDKVEAFVFIGTGVFHPLLVAFQTKKPVYAIDPFSGEMKRITGESLERERALRITKAMNTKSFGIVLSSKPGQYFPEIAERIAEEVRERGLFASKIIMDNISPEALDYLGFEAYVITACPRIVMDDWKNYRKPILLPDEVHDLLETR